MAKKALDTLTETMFEICSACDKQSDCSVSEKVVFVSESFFANIRFIKSIQTHLT